jgi:hypothetical protein
MNMYFRSKVFLKLREFEFTWAWLYESQSLPPNMQHRWDLYKFSIIITLINFIMRKKILTHFHLVWTKSKPQGVCLQLSQTPRVDYAF